MAVTSRRAEPARLFSKSVFTGERGGGESESEGEEGLGLVFVFFSWGHLDRLARCHPVCERKYDELGLSGLVRRALIEEGAGCG